MALMGDWELLLTALHSVGPHWENRQCFNLLESVSRVVWPCASLTRILSFQLMCSGVLAPLGFWMKAGNTKLSLSVNLTTLSKQNSGSVWKGLCWHTRSNFAAAVEQSCSFEYTAKTGGSGSRCPQVLFHHLPCYFSRYGELSYSCGWHVLPCWVLVLFLSWAVLAGFLKKGKEREKKQSLLVSETSLIPLKTISKTVLKLKHNIGQNYCTH